ncbi:MAG: hypothetical protein JSS81_13590 [Acidobacteria bacterium]|nr:hypothetical protein [Acidobacteriota bacterium]
MKKNLLLIVVLVLASLPVSAQLRKFRWETELCTLEGTYDAKTTTAERLRNTYRMHHSTDFDLDTIDATVFRWTDLGKLRTLASLDAEYRRKRAALEKLRIVETPFWLEFRKKKLVALERDYRLAHASVQSYRKPEALREVTFADRCIANYANPLIAGGDALLAAWRTLNEEQRRQNGDPERVRREYEAQLASPDRLNYARVEVTTFGWWNCVNAEIDRGDENGSATKNFESLFKKVRQIRCDEP